MALTMESATQPVIPSNNDFDMENGDEANEIDFDIDIELNESHDNVDVEVDDAPDQWQDGGDSHHADEMMYEEVTADDEVEMQEQHELDEDMDDTIYHEAQSEASMDRTNEDLLDNPSINAIVNDDDQLESYAEAEADAINQAFADETTLDVAEPSEKQTDAADDGSVATSGTLEPTIVEHEEILDRADALDEAGEARQHMNEVNPYDEQFSDEQHDEDSLSEHGQDGQIDQELAQNESKFIATHEPVLNEQHASHDKLPQLENSAHETRAKQETVASKQANQTEIAAAADDEYVAFTYNAMVQFKGQKVHLFPVESGGDFDAFLLLDSSLSEHSMTDLLAACRIQLADAVHDDQILGIEVSCLQLCLYENDADCTEITLSQIIDVYHHLHSNEESYEPEIITVDLTLRPKPITRLNQLFSAAEAGKGFSTMLSTNMTGDAEEDSIEASVNLEEQNGDEEEDPGNDNQENAGPSNSDTDSARVVHSYVADAATQDDSHDIVPKSNAPNRVSTAVNTTDDAELIGNDEEPPTEEIDTLDDFDADDLIDYSDDEEESAAAQVDSAAARTILDKPEIGVQSMEANTAINSAAIDEHHDREYGRDRSISEAVTQRNQRLQDDTNFAEDYKHSLIEESRTNEQSTNSASIHNANDTNTIPNSNDVEDDAIDFGFITDPTEQVPVGGGIVTASSPSAKRTWDEHAADSSIEVQAQDPKRIRSND